MGSEGTDGGVAPGSGGGGGVRRLSDRGRGWLNIGEGGGDNASSSLTNLRALMIAKARGRSGALPKVGARTYRTYIVQEFCQRGDWGWGSIVVNLSNLLLNL